MDNGAWNACSKLIQTENSVQCIELMANLATKISESKDISRETLSVLTYLT